MDTIRALSPALQKKAEEELFENTSRMQEDIEQLRSWILKQAHLHTRTDDQFLLIFLRGTKYSVERAKHKLDLFYTVRTASPELFKNRSLDDPKNIEILKMGVINFLPVPLPNDGSRVLLIRPGQYTTDRFHIREIMKITLLLSDVALREDDHLIVCGQLTILDLANATAEHLMQFDPAFIKKMLVLAQDASPVRQKGFHFINTPMGFESVFKVFHRFLNEKSKSRTRVHGNRLESLYKFVPKSCLPEEYGGDCGPIQEIVDYWEQKVLSYRDYYLEDEAYGVNEKLRPGRPRNPEELFGIDGTFRKLDID